MIGGLRVRLALSAAGVSLILWAGFGAWLYGSLRRGLNGAVDESVVSIADHLSGLLSNPEKRLKAEDLGDVLDIDLKRHRTEVIRILDVRGRVLEGSDALEQFPMSLPASSPATAARDGVAWDEVAWNGHRMRVVTVPVHGAGSPARSVQVGASLDATVDTLRRTAWVLLVGTPLVLLAAFAGGWVLADRALRPVGAMTTRAREIGGRNLNQRLPVGGADELGDLADTLNAMLDRLAASFRHVEEAAAQVRRFGADASHELRTPLTVLRGEAEVILRQVRSPEEYREALAHILTEAGRMGRIVDDLLVLAQSDAGEIRMSFADLEMRSLVAEVVGAMTPVATSGGVALGLSAGADGRVRADRAWLRQLLVNLIDNGIKYTPRGGTVAVSLGTVAGRVRVDVADTGIGIPAEALPHVFERFFRVDKARSREMGGSGLGLSIARWIAQSHGGTLEAFSERGRGSRFTLMLPTI